MCLSTWKKNISLPMKQSEKSAFSSAKFSTSKQIFAIESITTTLAYSIFCGPASQCKEKLLVSKLRIFSKIEETLLNCLIVVIAVLTMYYMPLGTLWPMVKDMPVLF